MGRKELSLNITLSLWKTKKWAGSSDNHFTGGESYKESNLAGENRKRNVSKGFKQWLLKPPSQRRLNWGNHMGDPPNTRVLNKKVMPLKPAAKKQEGKSALLTVYSKGFRRAHGASARSLIRLAYHILYCTSGLI